MSKKFVGIFTIAAITAITFTAAARAGDNTPCTSPGCGTSAAASVPQPVMQVVAAPVASPVSSSNPDMKEVLGMLKNIQQETDKIPEISGRLDVVEKRQGEYDKELNDLKQQVADLQAHMQANQQPSRLAQAPAPQQNTASSNIQWQGQVSTPAPQTYAPQPVVNCNMPATPWSYSPPQPVYYTASYAPPAGYPSPCDQSGGGYGYNAGTNNGGYTSSYGNGNNFSVSLGGLGGLFGGGGGNRGGFGGGRSCGPVCAPVCRPAPVCCAVRSCGRR